jgi:hypothetical protein
VQTIVPSGGFGTPEQTDNQSVSRLSDLHADVNLQAPKCFS